MSNTYDTSAEPLGSTAVKVVYNNASNLDDAVNSLASETWVDRPPFNRVRKTLFGYNQEFYRTLAQIGFESAYLIYTPGVPGVQIDRPTQLVFRSGIYYRVTDPTAVPLVLTGDWGIDGPKLTDVGDASLRAALSADTGSMLVTYGPAWTGAAALTQAAKNSQTLHIDDFPSTPANTWLSRAIDGTPDGWTLQLGLGPYLGKVSKARNNIRIVGMGMPRYNAGKTALVGGTIIQGYVALNGDSISVENFGIDCGSAVCTAINSGNAMDGLQLLDPARVERLDNVVRNIIVLCRDPGAPVHNFLLEGHRNLRFDNLHSRYGVWGVALKAKSSHGTGIYSYACAEAGFVFKSDTGVGGTRAEDCSVDGVHVFADDYAGALRGVFVYASTAPLFGFSMTNFQVEGCVEGIVFQCDARTSLVNGLFDVVVSNGILRNQAAYCISTVGAVLNVIVANVNCRAPGGNICVNVTSDCTGIKFVGCDMRPTAFNAANMNLAGRFSLHAVSCLVQGDYGTRGGINMTPDAKGSMDIGAIKGRTFFAGSEASITLQNGWTASAPVSVSVNNGRVSLLGRLAVPATPWTGKEQCGQLSADAIRPSAITFFTAFGLSATGYVPVSVRIETTGAILIHQLTITSAFPAAISNVILDGLSYPIPA